MNEAGRTIGLCMIVKNESHVILRCLESLRRLVDYVLIEDTGSTDGTQALVREWLGRVGLPGEIVEEPWRDFAFNRTHALAKLREHSDIDYALMIDADDKISVDNDFDLAAFKAAMTADFYDVEIRHGSMKHYRPHIFRNGLNFTYRGALHEFLEPPTEALARTTAAGFHITIVGGGARSQDKTKFQRDAALLEKALGAEQDTFLISRYTFYLAQSYRDSGERAKAVEAYLRRAELGYWDQEVFCSLYQAARIKEELSHDPDEIIALYLRASETSPGRAEALHAASHFCRSIGRNQQGYDIAKRGIDLKLPGSGLFVEPWVYEYGLLDEYAINAYWSGHYRECLDASLKLIANPACPAGQRGQFIANARFALDKLPQAPGVAQFAPLGHPGGQYELDPARNLQARPSGEPPKVLVAILAKQKEPMLPLYLRCIEALDYPKSSIVVYIRTNNNKDLTLELLSDWVERVRPFYAGVEMDGSDVPDPVEKFEVHEWNAVRFRVLGRIRNTSLQKALDYGCDYYFTADVDNFVRPCTLRELVALAMPIVAPLLRSVDKTSRYSNYHADIDRSGYFASCQQYDWILYQHIVGVFELPVVHCTYLIKSDVIPMLSYEDDSGRHEYVVFSESARRNSVPQYYDNRQLYGYLTLDENPESADKVAQLLADDLSAPSPAPWPDNRACNKKRATLSDEPLATLHEIHLINLDRSIDRLATFKDRNAHLKNILRFPAVNGALVNRDELVKSGIITDDLSYEPGALGCALSHIELWKKAASENRIVTIFEDDVICSLHFENESATFASALGEEWDFILWGYVFDPLYMWVDLGFSKAKLEFYDRRVHRDYQKFQCENFSRSSMKLAHSFGTQAYSVSPKGARALLENCLPLRDRYIAFPGAGVVTKDVGIDVAMCGAYDTLQAFVCIPPLVIQDNTQPSERLALNQTPHTQ